MQMPQVNHHAEGARVAGKTSRSATGSTKNLDLVWGWFYKDVTPTALFKCANPAK
jgi:hypothetical protein